MKKTQRSAKIAAARLSVLTALGLAIMKVITKYTLDDLLDSPDEKVENELTEICRDQLSPFGVSVHRCALTDFSTCRVYKVLRDSPFESNGEPIE